MKRQRRKSWLWLLLLWAPLLAGGLAPQLGGCDPNVKTAVETGLQTTLVNLPNQFINMIVTAIEHAITTQPAA
ncbi:MAG TPA: hypothetical protein VMV94_20445 [Phycisphaerae bacterium]|nr:hypothetical protein [Phycisphaerae bacterium]